jgi:hypothetical protein
MDDKLIEVLKKLAEMAEDGLSGHMYNTLTAIRDEARKAVAEAERGK